MNKIKSVSVFGLGKLGATTLAVFASKGFTVIGVDIVDAPVKIINDGKSPIYEPGVQDLIEANRDRISATTVSEDAVRKTDAAIIITPTPSQKNGCFSTQIVENAIKSIGKGLKLRPEDSYYLVVIVSTVCPGSVEDLINILEEESGKECGKDFGVVYSPDFIALGQIIKDILHPDLVLIGEYDEKSGTLYEEFVRSIVENTPEYHRMSICNAELCKIAINSFLVIKINFSNVISEICENMPSGNAYKVLSAIGSDKRINPKYILPGLAAAGPCLPRDSMAFKYAAEKFGVLKTFSESSHALNQYHKQVRLLGIIRRSLAKIGGTRISILGLTYKPDVSVTEESVSVEIARQLSDLGYVVRVYDPAGMESAKKDLTGYKVTFCDSSLECISGTHLCLIATTWKEFRYLTEEKFIDLMDSRPIIFDVWGIYVGTSIENSQEIEYKRLGIFDNSLNLSFLEIE